VTKRVFHRVFGLGNRCKADDEIFIRDRRMKLDRCSVIRKNFSRTVSAIRALPVPGGP
jgi:hypothetical protein